MCGSGSGLPEEPTPGVKLAAHETDKPLRAAPSCPSGLALADHVITNFWDPDLSRRIAGRVPTELQARLQETADYHVTVTNSAHNGRDHTQ